jgi:flagellar biosynthesis chaperone FliJ
MTGLVQRRARFARIRQVQHLQAAAQAAHAEGRVNSLENTAAHLSQLCHSLTPTQGSMAAAQLSNAAELAMRLDTVRSSLTDTIVSARATAVESAARRLEARIRQESAERLEERASRALALLRERKQQASAGRRKPAGAHEG